jgi:outer membrane lipoprotein
MRFQLNRNILFWLALFLSGCAPVLSQTVIDASERNILFGELQRNTDRYIGKSVVLGGTIVRVGNDSKGGWMEILQRPLGYRMEPELADRTEGRFLLRTDEIVDEQVFSKGRKITLAGKVEGRETRPLDQITYDYPLLRVEEYHLWPVARNRTGSGPNFGFSFGIFGSI